MPPVFFVALHSLTLCAPNEITTLYFMHFIPYTGKCARFGVGVGDRRLVGSRAVERSDGQVFEEAQRPRASAMAGYPEKERRDPCNRGRCVWGGKAADATTWPVPNVPVCTLCIVPPQTRHRALCMRPVCREPPLVAACSLRPCNG